MEKGPALDERAPRAGGSEEGNPSTGPMPSGKAAPRVGRTHFSRRMRRLGNCRRPRQASDTALPGNRVANTSGSGVTHVSEFSWKFSKMAAWLASRDRTRRSPSTHREGARPFERAPEDWLIEEGKYPGRIHVPRTSSARGSPRRCGASGVLPPPATSLGCCPPRQSCSQRKRQRRHPCE